MQLPLQIQPVSEFPVWTLPPMIRAAVEEVISVTQAPPALVASTALAAASLAVQSKYDIERSNGLTSPTSLFVITFAESGERKTTVDRMFFDSFNKFERMMSSEIGGIKENKREERRPSEQALSEQVRILYSDTTPVAFTYGLYRNSRSAGLCEDEAGRIFNSTMVDDLGLLNKLWNGSDVSVDRRYESYVVRAPRCTILWLVQPEVFRKFMEKKGEDARGVGFLARCLLSYPISTQGTRFLRGRPEKDESIRAFNARVFALLNDQINFLLPQSPVMDKVVLRFSPAAQVEWENIFNEIEFQIRPGGPFCEARDYASKVAENIARVAAVLHAYERDEHEPVSVDTLCSAKFIVLWYAKEFIRLFAPPGPQEVIIGYATLLDSWLLEYAKTTGKFVIYKNDILQLGPNRLRKRDILNIAIDHLVSLGRVQQNAILVPSDGRKIHRAHHVLQLSTVHYGQLMRGSPLSVIQPI